MFCGHPSVNHSLLIDISQLRIGMFIQLDVGWIHHPFPVSSFRIASAEQIDSLRSLGLLSVRYLPGKSDAPLPGAPATGSGLDADLHTSAPSDVDAPPDEEPVPEQAVASTGDLLAAQQRSLADCDRRFLAATEQYRRLAEVAQDNAADARRTSEALVASCVAQLLDNGGGSIRLLSESVGERMALHPVNVMVLCLLLGKAQGMVQTELHELGLAALLHDLGKLSLPAYLVQSTHKLSPADHLRLQAHVGDSVALAQRMDYPSAVLTAIAQHHELVDGSGYPLHLLGEDMGRAGRILALVNRYDGLCNPVRISDALTPHEALSVLFAQFKNQFDPIMLGAFIRMMGVYPPGSIVQLTDERYALVVAVNPARPLCPKLIVHDSGVPKDEALILNLERWPGLGIRRSLKPAQLPRETLDYLSPRQRICYFFERAVDLSTNQTSQTSQTSQVDL